MAGDASSMPACDLCDVQKKQTVNFVQKVAVRREGAKKKQMFRKKEGTGGQTDGALAGRLFVEGSFCCVNIPIICQGFPVRHTSLFDSSPKIPPLERATYH